MRFALKDYQADAVRNVLSRLGYARQDYHERHQPNAFALSATTGAGKTVIATAVIEALFDGSETFEVEHDPTAVVLWVTDDPSLNEQTRYRMLEAGDRLNVSRLTIIDSAFNQATFDRGKVYFLNIQKLSSSSTFVKYSDERTFTLWDTIRNTIEDETRTLYLILDEAHRGMNTTSPSGETARSTIVQRLVNGHENVPPAPIVWGISATIERFQRAINAAQAFGRTMYPAVQIDARTVQESGLLKDTILLDFPNEIGAFETALLRSAIHDMQETTKIWAAYAEQERMPDAVIPLMVLQVPNKPSTSELARYLDVIHDEWPGLEENAIANVFGDHTDLQVSGYSVPYIAPQYVQDQTQIRILLAKDAVSTGWDCPRAEVLFSLRPAKDRTHITQLLGRMVRTPLARRIESDERLNAVSCILPYFDRQTATEVANILTGEAIDQSDFSTSGEQDTGRKVLLSPVELHWNNAVPESLKDLLSTLPSEATPKGLSRPTKRLLTLAAEIAIDQLMPTPNEDALTTLYSILKGQLAQNEDTVQQTVADLENAEIQRLTATLAGDLLTESDRIIQADERTVDDAYRRASRTIGAAIANSYTRQLALSTDDEEGEFDFYDAKAQVAALLTIPEVIDRVEEEADKLTRSWLTNLRTKIAGLSEERRAVYNDIRRQDREPQLVEIVPPVSRFENTRDKNGDLLPTWDRHLLADAAGRFPMDMKKSDWEREVLETELSRPETVAWYRNPSTAKADALSIPYQLGDTWKPMQPDFIFFQIRKDGSIGASIVDPHGTHLGDALPKLKGLARFAEKYGDKFLRIEAIAKADNMLRMLDVKDKSVRSAIHSAAIALDLFQSDFANNYN